VGAAKRRAKRALRKRIFFGISMPSSLIFLVVLILRPPLSELRLAATRRASRANRLSEAAGGRALRAHGPLLAEGALRAQGMCLRGKHIQVVFFRLGPGGPPAAGASGAKQEAGRRCAVPVSR
jgi:hypothetical protein